MKLAKKITIALLGVLCFCQCARKGSPSGGPKDTIPPVLVRAIPQNLSKEIQPKKIRLQFDEYIKIKDLQKQLIVSPPLKNFPLINPQGVATKKVDIIINDTLINNTTYSFNFGNSIVDNNEENPLGFLNYVFSTGPVLDSLKLFGKVSFANSIKKVKDISIALYKADSTYNDSIVFKEKPLYVTNTKDTTLFAFNHLKEGAYKIIALEDKDKNFTYQPKKDRIAFIDSIIHLPSDALLSMKIFKETPALQFLRPKLINQGKIELGFQGNFTNNDCFKISSFPTANEYIIQPIKAKDSLHIWIKDSAYDSLTIDITKGLKTRKYTLKAKKKERDSLNIKLENSSVLDLTDTVRLALSTPVDQLEKSKFLLLEKDSIETHFDVFTDQYLNKVFVQFNKNPKSSYTLTVLPGAIHDFFGDQNKDSIQSTFKIPSEEEYGDLSLTIPNEEGKDLIVYLTDEKENTIAKKQINKSESLNFTTLKPKTYLIKIVWDLNKNEKWDTGDVLKNKQPEPVYFFPKKIKIRANWSIQEAVETSFK